MKIDHHRSLHRYVHVSDVHRSDRDEQGEAVRPRHAPARQPRQDRRDRNPLDDDGLLAVQRRRLLEVFVLREVGRRFPPTSATRATRWSPPPTPTSMRFSKGRRTWCRGAIRATAPKAARTPATDPPMDSCDVGVPSGVNIANRRFVVDETIGSVVVFCTFGAGNANGGSGCARYASLPRGERQAALRAHADASAAGELPWRWRRRPARRSWRSRWRGAGGGTAPGAPPNTQP